MAASFAVLATGSDTVNSLRSPASANSLVSVRPTRGLVSRAGIVPISYRQDAVGPIARTVRDAAVALSVMAGRARTTPVGWQSRSERSARNPLYRASIGPSGCPPNRWT